jgi:N-acetyl-gamma-glutamyl-phosphate reductase
MHILTAMGATAAVLGASGFAGGELARLLDQHPGLTATALGASTRAGRAAGDVLPHLAGGAGALVALEEVAAAEVDVCFSCLPSGALEPLLARIEAGVVVDLADDFRRDPGWAYGLPELNRAAVGAASRIANPGCYPTATLLCLAPFFRSKVVSGPVVVDALSGSSGAGRAEASHLMLAELAGNVTAYGTTEHRHVPEIEHWLGVFGGADVRVSFTPHLVPMARGVLVTARARLSESLTDESARDLLRTAYDGEALVHVVDGWPSTKPLTGTGRAFVSARVDERAGWLLASAAIDNLGKGAAAQAIQNANIALGLDETTGLTALGVWP